MRDNFLIFGSPQINREEIDEVIAAMKSGWIGTGPRVEKFERQFATFKGVENVVAVNSGTAALHLSILAAGIGPGDEVITTPLTFCATINAIIHSGAIPVLVDIDPDTMNIDPDKIESAISTNTKAILPVHFAGRPCDMDKIINVATSNDLIIIEDCAHAIEAEYKGVKIGAFGEFACFSFYVTKNVITGEGGMVICQNNEHAALIKQLALHGMSHDAWKRFSDTGYKHYFVVEPGFKYNMMDLQAAIGIHQLERVEENLKRREAIWAIYDAAFAGLPLTLPALPEEQTRHARHLYTVLVNDDPNMTRDLFIKKMTELNIGVGVHYMSIPEHPYYQRTYSWKPEQWPIAMDIGRRTVSLPLSPAISDRDVNDVIESVHDIL